MGYLLLELPPPAHIHAPISPPVENTWIRKNSFITRWFDQVIKANPFPPPAAWGDLLSSVKPSFRTTRLIWRFKSPVKPHIGFI